MTRPRFLIALLGLLPAPLLLAGCGASGPPQPPPLDEQALAAVSAQPGTPREGLARAVDSLFTEGDSGETQALIVMYRGEIVAERYGENFRQSSRFLGWSMAKTVTALAIGMLVADGRLALNDSPPIPNWQRSGDPRGEITLKQLLQMRSGLRHRESSDVPYETDTARLLFLDGRDDMATQAEAQPLEAEAGRKFKYSTASSIILSDIAARVLTNSDNPARRRGAMDDFLKTRLFRPLGLHSMVAEYDAAGTMIGGAMISATARDWAKMGEFMRHGGSVGGAQIIPRRWVEFMRAPSPRAPDFGANLWLNRNSGGERDVLFAKQGPASLFAAIGHLGQYVIISPRQKLTIVRLGKTPDEDRPALISALAKIVALYPGG